MTEKESIDSLTEATLAREIEDLLAIAPAPEFLARIHARIAEEPSLLDARAMGPRKRWWNFVRPIVDHTHFGERRFLAAFAIVSTVAIVILASLYVRKSLHLSAAPAVVTEGSLYRTSGEMNVSVRTGQTLEFGETVHSNDANGTLLALVDGSRIETRTESEISLERADDGTRIRLLKGSMVVNAAKQRAGRHLYVQTEDVTVSVVGTVFLVSAEHGGSRVGVFEGEVLVRQGTTEKRLLPGQQITTSLQMETRPLQEEVVWSRRAEGLRSLLRQSSVALQVKGQNSTVSRQAFEVVSIRPRAASFGGRSGVLPSGFTPACNGNPQIDPVRFSINNTTVFQLIALAYGESCARWEQQESDSDALSGGPPWIREDRFDVEAVFPQGTPTYTPAQLARGRAPVVHAMLQTMLADRFGLVLEHRMKEMQVYMLTVATGGSKLTPSQDGNTRGVIRTLRMGADGQPRPTGVSAGAGGMNLLALALSNYLGRPVLDRTGIAYDFSFNVDFALPDDDCPSCPTAAIALQDKLGLKLDKTRASVDVLAVARVEKPSAN